MINATLPLTLKTLASWKSALFCELASSEAMLGDEVANCRFSWYNRLKASGAGLSLPEGRKEAEEKQMG